MPFLLTLSQTCKAGSMSVHVSVCATGAVPAIKPEATAIGDPQDGRWKITLTLTYSMSITVRNQWTKVSHAAF